MLVSTTLFQLLHYPLSQSLVYTALDWENCLALNTGLFKELYTLYLRDIPRNKTSEKNHAQIIIHQNIGWYLTATSGQCSNYGLKQFISTTLILVKDISIGPKGMQMINMWLILTCQRYGAARIFSITLCIFFTVFSMSDLLWNSWRLKTHSTFVWETMHF